MPQLLCSYDSSAPYSDLSKLCAGAGQVRDGVHVGPHLVHLAASVRVALRVDVVQQDVAATMTARLENRAERTSSACVNMLFSRSFDYFGVGPPTEDKWDNLETHCSHCINASYLGRYKIWFSDIGKTSLRLAYNVRFFMPEDSMVITQLNVYVLRRSWRKHFSFGIIYGWKLYFF